MKMRPLALLIVASTAMAVSSIQFFGVEPNAAAQPADKASKKPATDWKDDPVCQMVFFAVLEGLYADGVPDDIVDSIVPRKKNADDNPLKASFVVQCPLCHAVYEAFSLYQQRPGFGGDEKKRITFGKGLDAKWVKELKSSDNHIRLTALRLLLQSWIERRLTMMRLTDSEKGAWTDKLGERSEQGRVILSKLRRDDPHYKTWSPYWGCAACNAALDANRVLTTGGKKE